MASIDRRVLLGWLIASSAVLLSIASTAASRSAFWRPSFMVVELALSCYAALILHRAARTILGRVTLWLAFSVGTLVCLWLGLNSLRSSFYGAAVENKNPAPYWHIVGVQEVLQWLLLPLVPLLAISLIYLSVHIVVSRVRRLLS